MCAKVSGQGRSLVSEVASAQCPVTVFFHDQISSLMETDSSSGWSCSVCTHKTNLL